MKYALLPGLALIASPALAQPMDHSMHGMDHGAMDHGAMEMPPPPAAPPPPKPTEAPAHHDHGAAPSDAGMPSGLVGTDAAPGNAPPPPVVHDRPADAFYGAAAMAPAEAAMMQAHGKATYAKLTFDLAEYQFREGKDGYRWEAEAWFGDLDRVVLRSKGEGTFREGVDHAEVQALYSKALDPWWNLQVGIRQDIQPKPVRTHAVIGVEGRAPYQFDVQAAAFLSQRGEVTGRVEGTYDQRLTQRLILQPRAELNLSAQDMPDIGIGSGLTSAELGLRLRYEIRREFAPYVGVSWTWLAGRTADHARAAGHDPSEGSVVLGVRSWF
ncbi:copper resistance protein B [Novosphingobium sp. KCTC 2891]|uniref:copper resistance protein B n=1 Tax=Novosphingobium sp. KCTC 2891 TaxID=2989730 RepID=UPI0022214742|nr:copper resistance protein B [Novosphingobium sp. KCTC 2891]MCW1382522.1 copper resistance protein B [Novosphingobium sp. KCTC 2891]